MKIAVLGGGPGGLYFSLLTKKRWPECDIDVYEQNRADDTFGFGVVFSDETLDEFLNGDAAWPLQLKSGEYQLYREAEKARDKTAELNAKARPSRRHYRQAL
jgi:anthraniloyl-CoA monooxygenase